MGIGAPLNDDILEDSGRVKVYVLEGEGVAANRKQLGRSIHGASFRILQVSRYRLPGMADILL